MDEKVKALIKLLENTEEELKDYIIKRFERIYMRKPTDLELSELLNYPDTDMELYSEYEYDDILNETYDKGYIFAIKYIKRAVEKIFDIQKETVKQNQFNNKIKKNRAMNNYEIINYINNKIDIVKKYIYERFKKVYLRDPNTYEQMLLLTDLEMESEIYKKYTIAMLNEEAIDKGYLIALEDIRDYILKTQNDINK